MNRQEAGKIHEAINAAMKPVAEEFGLVFKPGRLSYSDTDVSCSVKFKAPVTGVDAEDPYSQFTTAESVEAFKRVAEHIGLEAADIFKSFDDRGTLYVIVGYNSKRRKYPISVVRVSDNKKFKFVLKDVVALRERARKSE